MKKMKILLILALLLIGVVFSLHADIAKNIQGKILVWNGFQWAPADNEEITVILYNDEAHGGTVYDSANIETDENGNYSWDFRNPNTNWEECDKVEVIFRTEPYSSSYDGIERIDIWWYQAS
ncbi:MAG: hypothetical protein HQ534_12455 [Armatimonadetes bacterium]|nr:hypothetical protein [Armatimonadota bacterium]